MYRRALQAMHLQAAEPQTVAKAVATTPCVVTASICNGSKGIDRFVLARDPGFKIAGGKAHLSNFPNYRYELRAPWANPNFYAQWTRYLEAARHPGTYLELHYEILSVPTPETSGILQILGLHKQKDNGNDCPICNEQKTWDRDAVIARCRELGWDPFSERKGKNFRSVKKPPNAR